MKTQEREAYMLKRLEAENILTISELIKDTGASEATIRRDFQKLEEQGSLRRIPGGAIRPIQSGFMTQSSEIGMHHRMSINAESKEAVARLACETIKDGECIFLDGGSSIVPMIHYLKDRPIRIITHNNLLIAQLDDHVKADIIAIGGSYSREYAMNTGAEAVRQVQQYCYDRCFISCVAFNLADGMTYTTETETRDVKIAAIENSSHSYLLVDRSKENMKAFCRMLPLSSFETVYSDTRSETASYPEQFQFADEADVQPGR